VTVASLADLRSSLYEAHASQHAGRGEVTVRLGDAAVRRALRDHIIGHHLATIIEKLA